jgi:hypothetical protein
MESYYIHGDPLQLIAGTERNTKSFLTEDNISQFQGFNLARLSGFFSATPMDEIHDGPTVESGNEANQNEGDPETPDRYRDWEFTKSADGFIFKASSDTKDELVFTWQKNPEGNLDLVSALGYPTTVHHYSLGKNQDKFSVLVSMSFNDKQEALVWATFVKPKNFIGNDALTDKKFNYLLGKGVKTRWEGDLSLDLCGASIGDLERSYLQAMLQWTSDEKVGQRPFKLNTNPKKTPFSDVDSHCLVFANTYRYGTSTKYTTVGAATLSYDYSAHSIIDGEIFIFNGSIDSYCKQWKIADCRSIYEQTIKHEFGHWLGLDHEFDKDQSGQPLQKSIMSYDFEPNVTPHDFEATEQLYGAYTPLSR